MSGTPERGNQSLDTLINRQPELAGSLRVIKGMLAEAGSGLHLSPGDLWYTDLSGHQWVVGVGVSWERWFGDGTIHAEAGVMINTEPTNIAEEELPDDAAVKIEVFSRIRVYGQRIDMYKTYGDHRRRVAYYSPEAFETDLTLQQRLRDQISQELPQAVEDRDRAPQIVAEKLQSSG